MKLYTHILIIIFLSLAFASSGQQNPFDLKHRLNRNISTEVEKTTISPTETEPITEVEIAPVESPGKEETGTGDVEVSESTEEVHATPVMEESEPTETSGSAPEVSLEIEKEPVREEIINPGEIQKDHNVVPLPPILQEKRNLIFATFLILLIMLTLVITINRSVVDHIIRAFMNDNFLNLLYREQRGKTNVQYLFLYFFFIANFGFFIFLSLDYWFEVRPEISLLFCILIVGVIYLIRYLILDMLATTFPVEKEARQFNFTIIIFNILLGLILLPINLFLAFAPSKISIFSFYLGLFLIVFFYLIRQLRGLFISVRFLSASKFQFFTYLCTVEIAPLLVGMKVFNILTG